MRAAPGQTVGPFFHLGLPFDGGNELVPPGSPGAIRLSGRVLDGAGDPVPDALVEIWQAGPDGQVVKEPGSLRRDGWTFTGWGRAATDPYGHYWFSTLRPGPSRPGRPAFFAVTVFARGLMDRLFTRAYLPESGPLEADPLLAGLPAERRATLVAVPEARGLRFDIHLQGEAETVFLSFAGESAVVTLAATVLADAPGRPLLLLGPSLGTSAAALWGRCAGRLRGGFHVVGWDLPGHGRSAPATTGWTVAELTREVVTLADQLRPGEPFRYAGDSLGGAVGLQLLLDVPERVIAAALFCTGAKIGEATVWQERAAVVRADGIESMVAGSLERWFAPGFAQREPAVTGELLAALRATDPESYALACEALADFDVRDRLGAIGAPVLAIAGAHDKPTPPANLELIAGNVQKGRLAVLDGVAHLAPAELPDGVATLLDGHFGDSAGLAVRRAVLGDAHVDRAQATTTGFTRDFQDLITAYAWGEIWTRPALDRRSRSMITLTALVALGHAEELAMHVRVARTNGLTDDEIKEVLLQAAIYCGVPAANTAFRIAQKVLGE